MAIQITGTKIVGGVAIRAALSPMIITYNSFNGSVPYVTLPLYSNGAVTVDWGDGQSSSLAANTFPQHNYSSTPPYTTRTITITPADDSTCVFDTYGYNNVLQIQGITGITSWGGFNLTKINFGVGGGAVFSNLTTLPSTIPSSVINLSKCFYQGQVANFSSSLFAYIQNWDVSKVTDMSYMFFFAGLNFNTDISGWNTGSVTNMEGMFYNAQAFNRDLSGWNVSSVTNHINFSTGATAWVLPKPTFPS